MNEPLTESEIVDLLKGSKVFASVPQSDLQALAIGFVPRSFSPGEMAVREGERGDEIFLVIQGQFEVFSSGKGEEKEILGTLGRGDLFGEMATLTGGRRYASVVASTEASALVKPEAAFHKVLRSSRALSEAILRSLERYS